MNANDLIEFQEDKASEARANGFSDVRFMQTDTMLRQLQAENKKLKDFVKPILASGDECVGDWGGDELQDLAVKTGLYIEKVMTEPCNKDKEEFVACPCREYHYDDESWVCYRISEFLTEETDK